ncbi:MAG TPA: flagellar export chaperone FliS [Verrucomicrobiales bacterium]|nr:flagellar export chaperone FliS [Pedosphaera sp.]HAO67859.1 flagellar export chaperone FliS [Verrucomicrobiales bacterium]HAQ98885.1 flagellar export chaperone FliS [Verrucomicrobiales bacterium]|tara:strand:+ start:761 stop:1156 length:396 start_codon:yes stop_codon:yes gene_type:complete
MLRSPLQSYKTISLETAPPGQLVLMLFDGAIKFLERAKLGFGIEDPVEMNETVHNNITRAQDIINELNSTLNMDQGGEVAVVLRDLYVYLDNRLFESNIRKELEGVQEVIDRLSTVQAGWSEMLELESAVA